MTDDNSTQHVEGTFNTPVPCPECGTFMSTGYGPMGLPSAGCSNPACTVDHVPDDWLKANGYWAEHS